MIVLRDGDRLISICFIAMNEFNLGIIPMVVVNRIYNVSRKLVSQGA